MDTHNFIIYIKRDDISKGIGEDVKKKFDTLIYELDILLPKRKSKRSNWINKR